MPWLDRADVAIFCLFVPVPKIAKQIPHLVHDVVSLDNGIQHLLSSLEGFPRMRLPQKADTQSAHGFPRTLVLSLQDPCVEVMLHGIVKVFLKAGKAIETRSLYLEACIASINTVIIPSS